MTDSTASIAVGIFLLGFALGFGGMKLFKWLGTRQRSHAKGIPGRVANIIRAELNRADFNDTTLIPRNRHEEEASEWIADFQDAEPIIDMSTPEGRAYALRCLEEERLPRYERRMRGLL